MAITAALVKELRERTGAGMMECKKALVESDGDIEAAIEQMRKSGSAKAAKKAGRTAADGLVIVKISDDGGKAVITEVNCETDFVAKDENFSGFAEAVAECALKHDVDSIEALSQLPLKKGEAQTVEEARTELVAKIGENMSVRRFERIDAGNGMLASYRHGVRIGVVVVIEGGDEALGKDIAMHVAASNPAYISEDQVDPAVVEKEKEIFRTQALESGKPENIVDKIIAGRVRKFLGEITLVGQPFVKDPDVTVGKLLSDKGATVKRICRYEVGEGIEKKNENFADEVMAQVRG